MSDHKPHIMHVGYNDAYRTSMDFDGYRVSLLLHSSGIPGLAPEMAARFDAVVGFDTPDGIDIDGYFSAAKQILAGAEKIAAELGPPTAVIGLFEHTILPAAMLRDHFGVAGLGLATAELFRDKVKMKAALLGSEVRVPAFAAVSSHSSAAEVAEAAASIPGRIVLKPRSQAASFGVRIFGSADELLAFHKTEGLPDAYEIEEFIDGDVYHFDGIVRDGDIRFFSASRYLDTCFDFQFHDVALASVTLDDPEVVEQARHFTLTVLSCLGLEDSSFHLEAFRTPTDELVFLEVASRFGGAGVVPQIESAYGVDLISESFLACVGEPSRLTRTGTILDFATVGASAWLYLPMIEKAKCVVRGIRGLETCPSSVVKSELPSPGQVLNQSPGVYVASGKFILHGASTDVVVRDLRTIIDQYSLVVEVLAG